MASAVGLVDVLIVGNAVDPEAMDDLDPSLCEAAESGVVVDSVSSLGLVEVGGPATGREGGTEGEEEQRLVDDVIASASAFDVSRAS